MSQFKFNLEDTVRHHLSPLYGRVIARCESVVTDNQYQIEYISPNGEVSTTWFYESQLSN